MHCRRDNSVELTGAAILHRLHINSTKDDTITVWNSHLNAICDQLHQSVSNTLQTVLHTYPPDNIGQSNDITDTCLLTAAYASMVVICYTLNMSYGALVLQGDMILNKPLITDLLQHHEQQQIIIDKQLCHSIFLNI